MCLHQYKLGKPWQNQLNTFTKLEVILRKDDTKQWIQRKQKKIRQILILLADLSCVVKHEKWVTLL